MNLPAALALALLTTAAGPQPEPRPSIDPEHSSITVYVYKQGLFAFLADNHVINAPIASVSYDSERKAADLAIDVAKMQVLDPHLSADKRASVQSNMLGPQVLDAAKYPTITFQSTSVEDAPNGGLNMTGNLTIHGQTHSITLELTNAGAGLLKGSAMVRQTAYGITPIKIAGGAVSVKDDVRIEVVICCLHV